MRYNQVLFCHSGYLIDLAPFFENNTLSQGFSVHLFRGLSIHICLLFFLDFLLCSTVFCLAYCNLTCISLSGRVSLPTFFFGIDLDILGPLHFDINFKFPCKVCQVVEKKFGFWFGLKWYVYINDGGCHLPYIESSKPWTWYITNHLGLL